MDLDAAQAFFERLLELDEPVWRAAAAHDVPGLLAARARLAPLMTAEVAHGWERLPPPEPPVARRTLFAVRRHDHPSGPLGAALVSEATRASRGDGKFALLLLARADGGAAAGAEGPAARVVSVWFVCTACVTLGVDHVGHRCLECGGAGWERWFGEALDGPGDPVATRPLVQPEASLYHAAWKRELRRAREH